MNNPRFIQRFLSLLSIAMLLLFTAWMTIPGYAEEAEELEIEVEADGTQSYVCGQTLRAEGDVLIAQYQTFLDLQTKDSGDNSDRLEHIMSFYRYVTGTLDDRFEELIVDDLEGESLESSTDEYEYCNEIKEQYIMIADSMLRTFYVSSSSSKTTFQVIDGLKAMNTDLESMSQSFHATFPSMFNKFSNAFPCYIQSCITR